jgi:hypothetical protein
MSRHEETDVNINRVFGVAAGLAGVTAAAFVIVWLLFLYLDRREAASAASEAPVVEGQGLRQPPEPRLQISPRTDLLTFRAAEDAVLDGYQWADKTAGTIRISISEAMKLVVRRGLPARESSQGSRLPPQRYFLSGGNARRGTDGRKSGGWLQTRYRIAGVCRAGS